MTAGDPVVDHQFIPTDGEMVIQPPVGVVWMVKNLSILQCNLPLIYITLQIFLVVTYKLVVVTYNWSPYNRYIKLKEIYY